MAEKSLMQTRADFFGSLMESVSNLNRLEAEQRLSRIFCDLWNEAEQKVMKMPAKMRRDG